MKNKSDLFKTNLIYFILIVSFVIIRIIASLGIFGTNSEILDYIFTFIIQIGIMLLLPLFLTSLLKKQKPIKTINDFKLKKVKGKVVLIALVIGICVYILNIGVSSIFAYLLSLLGYNPTGTSSVVDATWQYLILSTIFVAVLPGFCEEVAHRGLLLNGLSSLGTKNAIIFSSILFGLMHLNISQFFYASIIGGILAILTIASGSIIPAMIVHFMNNFINVVVSYVNAKYYPEGSLFEAILNGSGSFDAVSLVIFAMIVFVSVILLIVYLVKLLFKQTFTEKLNKIKKEAFYELLKHNLTEEYEEEKTPLLKDINGFEFEEEIDVDGTKKLVKIKVPFEKFGLNFKQKIKPKFSENIFLYASIVLGVIVTIFTYIWGIIA